MKPSLAPHRKKQALALSNARAWIKGNSLMMFKRYVLKAAKFHPLSEMQWWGLKTLAGGEVIRELKEKIGR